MNSPQVLIVDDESDIRFSIAEYLKDEYVSLEAASGIEALRILKESPIDLVVTDYNMGEMDGFELIKSMHESAIDVPVIVLTGRGSQELHVQAMAYDIFEYIEKPFQMKYLRNAIKKCLLHRQDKRNSESFPNIFSKISFEDLHLKIPKAMVTRLREQGQAQGLSVNAFIEKIINEHFTSKKS